MDTGSLAAGLPNITGEFATDYNLGNNYKGAFYKSSSKSSNKGGAGEHTCIVNGFSASRNNSIYGSSDTVQPLSLKSKYYIKF